MGKRGKEKKNPEAAIELSEALNGDLMLGDLACHKTVTGLYFFLSGWGEWQRGRIRRQWGEGGVGAVSHGPQSMVWTVSKIKGTGRGGDGWRMTLGAGCFQGNTNGGSEYTSDVLAPLIFVTQMHPGFWVLMNGQHSEASHNALESLVNCCFYLLLICILFKSVLAFTVLPQTVPSRMHILVCSHAFIHQTVCNALLWVRHCARPRGHKDEWHVVSVLKPSPAHWKGIIGN